MRTRLTRLLTLSRFLPAEDDGEREEREEERRRDGWEAVAVDAFILRTCDVVPVVEVQSEMKLDVPVALPRDDLLQGFNFELDIVQTVGYLDQLTCKQVIDNV